MAAHQKSTAMTSQVNPPSLRSWGPLNTIAPDVTRSAIDMALRMPDVNWRRLRAPSVVVAMMRRSPRTLRPAAVLPATSRIAGRPRAGERPPSCAASLAGRLSFTARPGRLATLRSKPSRLKP